MPPNEPRSSQQACAIPYRRREGRLEFCLITSSNGRWMFPKGVVEQGDSLEETALKEAYEEAGVQGRIHDEPVGRYETPKWEAMIPVTVMMMEVEFCEDDWAEAEKRQRRWVTPTEARRMVDRPELQHMVDLALERLESE